MKESLTRINQGLSIDQENNTLVQQKFHALRLIGELEQASKLIEDRIREGTASPDAICNLGRVYLEENKNDLSRKVYLRGLEIHPGNRTILEQYANFLSELGYHRESALYYSRLLRDNDKEPRYWTLIGNQYLELELLDAAFEAYRKGDSQADPKQGWILSNIGNILTVKGFHTFAIEYLRRALEVEPNSQYAHDRLSIAIKEKAEVERKRSKILEEAQLSEAKMLVDIDKDGV